MKHILKIVVLGATGRTGKLVIEKAISRGHEVIAIARDAVKLSGYNVRIVHGTPYDYATVERAVTGCDAVINLLDVSRKTGSPWAKLTAPKDLISKSASNAVKAMERQGVKRFIALSTIGAGRSWKTAPLLLKFVVATSNMKYAFQDLGREEELLEESSLDYTICRAPKLTDKIYSDGGIAVTLEESEQTINPLMSRLSRESAAEYCLMLVEKNCYCREVINLTNVKANRWKMVTHFKTGYKVWNKFGHLFKREEIPA